MFRCLALHFNFDYRATLLLVLWALGWAMIGLSMLIYLPRPAIAASGVVLILGHNALDAIRSSSAPCTRCVRGTQGSNNGAAIRY